MFLACCFLVPETLPKDRRHGGGLAALTRNMNYVVRNACSGLLAGFAFGFGAFVSYISAVVVRRPGGDGPVPRQFSIVFAINSAGIVAGSIVNTNSSERSRPANC